MSARFPDDDEKSCESAYIQQNNNFNNIAYLVVNSFHIAREKAMFHSTYHYRGHPISPEYLVFFLYIKKVTSCELNLLVTHFVRIYRAACDLTTYLPIDITCFPSSMKMNRIQKTITFNLIF